MNNTYIDVFIYFVSCYVYYNIFILYSNAIFEPMYSRKIYYITILINSLIQMVVNFFNMPLINLGMTILLSFVTAKMLYNSTRKKYWLHVISVIVVLGSIEALVVQIFIIIKLVFMININENRFEVIISTLSIMLVYKIVEKVLLNKKINYPDKKYSIYYIFLISFSFINIYVLMVLAERSQQDYIVLLAWLCILLLVILNIISVDIIDLISKSQKTKVEFEIFKQRSDMQYNYFKSIEQKYLATRKTLHDIENHIQTLESMYKTNEVNVDNYKGMIHNIIDHLGQKRYSISTTLNIILNDKESICEQNQVSIEFKEECIDLSFICDYDMVTIFGNLLDNAINAVKKLEIEKRKIELNIKRINKIAIINIKNYYELDTEYKNHEGFGLLNVKKSIEKYEGVMYIYKIEGKFEVNIHMLSE